VTWQERVDHIRGFFAERTPAQRYREVIAQRLWSHEHGVWQAADSLGRHIAELVLIEGPAVARDTFAQVKHVLPQAAAAYIAGVDPAADEVEPTVFDMIDATNAFEVIGFEVPASILSSFRPLLPRVADERDRPRWRWAKGFAALAMGDRFVWAPVAGFLPDDPVPFEAGATFGPDLQGLLAYLGGARLAKASFADVEPAWRSFMATADTLIDMGQLDYPLVLWIARIVFHHIGGKPLASVGELLYADIQRCIAAGI
jgi:hypothetical protein